MKLPDLNSCSIAVIGMGYVGLPLALEFAKSNKCLLTDKQKTHKVIGFDINTVRLDELKNNIDKTKEINEENLKYLDSIYFTNDIKKLEEAEVFIVTVPTPINKENKPDLTAIEKSSNTVGKALHRIFKAQDINNENSYISPLVIYESTVYPGLTEEICIPILERESGKRINHDFFCGYSPERINPGDKKHRLIDILKVTSGSNEQSANWIDSFYGSIIKAGTHKASSIKVAEAAKIIENTQRDLNIALINEIAMILKKLNIDTLDVLEAACTKWNFLPFRPGLVGGHCIGVDPYYLTYQAEKNGHLPKVVLAGREINNSMGAWIADQLSIAMLNKNLRINKTSVLILGFSFKENCPDIRNTKVIDIVKSLNSNKVKSTIVDPLVEPKEAIDNYGLNVINSIPKGKRFDGIVLAVAHKEFNLIDWQEISNKNTTIFDLKGIVPRELNPIRI